MHVNTYIYIYICIDTHTHTHVGLQISLPLSLGLQAPRAPQAPDLSRCVRMPLYLKLGRRRSLPSWTSNCPRALCRRLESNPVPTTNHSPTVRIYSPHYLLVLIFAASIRRPDPRHLRPPPPPPCHLTTPALLVSNSSSRHSRHHLDSSLTPSASCPYPGVPIFAVAHRDACCCALLLSNHHFFVPCFLSLHFLFRFCLSYIRGVIRSLISFSFSMLETSSRNGCNSNNGLPSIQT